MMMKEVIQMTISPEMFATIHAEAVEAAKAAVVGLPDNDACGFAWVEVFGVRSNSKLGKAMVAAGFRKSYTGALTYRNPSKAPVQSVGVLGKGAVAYANVLKKYGFAEAYGWSRLD